MNLIFEKAPHVRWYSDLKPFVTALASRLDEFVWRFDAVEGAFPPQGQEDDDFWILSGNAFADLVEDHPQFTWAVVSALAKHCSGDEINALCVPYADGNPTFWTGSPRPQHPFAEFEIVCWDGSATLLIGADESIAAAFQTAYPEAIDLDRENEDRDRTKR
ncbi:hypothetical protein [Neorhodopirellula pilleata]|uniref:hypothetical protein n=1 Tax=Neorhodopirellula pilleata TaxID=2714738 RepID=UPI0011B4F1D2|nr:hypothetical protein [Neorhodopirellula pilleata]